MEKVWAVQQIDKQEDRTIRVNKQEATRLSLSLCSSTENSKLIREKDPGQVITLKELLFPPFQQRNKIFIRRHPVCPGRSTKAVDSCTRFPPTRIGIATPPASVWIRSVCT